MNYIVEFTIKGNTYYLQDYWDDDRGWQSRTWANINKSTLYANVNNALTAAMKSDDRHEAETITIRRV